MKPFRLILALCLSMSVVLSACEFDFALEDLGLMDQNSPQAQEPDFRYGMSAASILATLRTRSPRNVYRVDQLEGVCEGAAVMRDEARVQALASLKSLEFLQNYRTLLDDKYEEARKSAVIGATVDLAAIAAGWPLGNALTNRLRGEFQATLTQNIVKAGFKSINQRILKDQSLAGVWDQTTTVAPFEGLGSDLAWEVEKGNIEKALGATAAESTFLVFDSAKLAYSVYQGADELASIRQIINTTNEHIRTLEAKHANHVAGLERMSVNYDRCEHQRKLGLHPFEDESYLVDTIEMEKAYFPPELSRHPLAPVVPVNR
jgi:hypothetical protein